MSEQQTTEAEKIRQVFIGEYNALCKKFGVQLAASPVFIWRDDGTYSVVVKFSVMELPKELAAKISELG